MKRERVILMGAAGRDFHNFLVFFKDKPEYEVLCFTASQIPGIENRALPKELTGKFYPKGIPIYPEERLPGLIKKQKIDTVFLCYSDLSYISVMRKASLVNTCGASFSLLSPEKTMLKSGKPVIAVTAVRTGCGKSQTTRKIARILKSLGFKVAVVRHPMPYGNLRMQVCQTFASLKDLDRHECTVEEREEYEPLIKEGISVFSGLDFRSILSEAEKAGDIIIWDGGNNDTPFFRPDLHICLVDPLRAGHEVSYYPGEVNFRMADIIIINKERTASKDNIETVKSNIRKYNPKAKVIHAASVITVSNPGLLRNKKVLVVEDGPSITHGGLPFGAGMLAARRFSARPVDPRPYAVGTIKAAYKLYPHTGPVLPCLGYSERQISDLEKTINRIPCQAVVSATPVDLKSIINIRKPTVRVTYELKKLSRTGLETLLKKFLERK